MSLAQRKDQHSKEQYDQFSDFWADFEEKLMFGDLNHLIEEMGQDRSLPDELVQGVESLKFFREFYAERRAVMVGDDRARLAAYDAAWCLELINIVQRERSDRHYRA